jgi:hypothetical protein
MLLTGGGSVPVPGTTSPHKEPLAEQFGWLQVKGYVRTARDGEDSDQPA